VAGSFDSLTGSGGVDASGVAEAVGVADRAAGRSPCVVTGKACPINET
jgi:hypothetical protein